MAIKNKDGSLYKLSSPNPVMSQQTLWEDSVLHNLDYPEMTTKEAMEEIQDIPTEELEVEAYVTEVPGKKRIISAPKETVHCLPATVTEYRDHLYGEVRAHVSYGKKTTMEVIIVDQSDIALQVWTNSIKINPGSIIYRPANLRWWKVDEIGEKFNGFIIGCSPSSFQPSF